MHFRVKYKKKILPNKTTPDFGLRATPGLPFTYPAPEPAPAVAHWAPKCAGAPTSTMVRQSSVGARVGTEVGTVEGNAVGTAVGASVGTEVG